VLVDKLCSSRSDDVVKWHCATSSHHRGLFVSRSETFLQPTDMGQASRLCLSICRSRKIVLINPDEWNCHPNRNGCVGAHTIGMSSVTMLMRRYSITESPIS